MLTIYEIAEMIESGLNQNQNGIVFQIGANVDDFRKQKDIPLNSDKPTRGIVYFMSGDTTPIKNLGNVDTVVVLELLVAQPNLKKVSQVLSEYALLNVGETNEENADRDQL